MDRELNLLFPLDRFYAPSALPLPTVSRIPAKEVPDPYGRLLVGNHDMTPTLEAFHGARIQLRVLERQQDDDKLARLVVLTLEGSAQPVEFGAILIHLSHFPPAARERILEGRCPLGTILATYCIEHVSRPQAFMRVVPDTRIAEALCLSGQRALYGRRNVLLTLQNDLLADIVEILPP
jgi:chorismate-pyruvate lyase